MAQTAVFRLNDGRIFQDIRIFAGEALRLDIEDRDPETTLVLTIGLDASVPPLIQTTGTDSFDLAASALAVLPEGRTCMFNLWQQGEGDPVLVKRGSFLARASLQPVGLPIMIRMPQITGAPVVGTTLMLDAGAWQDADTVAWVWLRNGLEVGQPGTDSYQLTDQDDAQSLGAIVTASNANGSVTAQVPDIAIRHSAPYATGVLADQSLALGVFASLDLSIQFSGAALAFALASNSDPLPEGLTLTNLGLLSGTPTQLGQASLIVRATNSGGYADLGFALTIAQAAPVFTETPRLIVVGDSIMAYRPGASDWTERYVGDQVYLPDGFMQAVAGSSSQDMIDRMPQTLGLVRAGETIALVGPIGENRETGASTYEEITADIDTIFSQLTAAGATVVAVPTLPETNEHSAADLKQQLAAYVRSHPGVHVVDIGRRDPVTLSYDPAQAYDPYTHTNDTSHPNGEGARFLAGRIRQVMRPLVTASDFDAPNLLAGEGTFPGSTSSTATGVQGDLPTNWQAMRTGNATWTVGKTGLGAAEITVVNAAEPTILTLTLPAVAISGAPGDVFDCLVEAQVDPASTGYRGIQVVQTRGGEENATSQLPPIAGQPVPDHTLYIRTRGKPLSAAQTSLDVQIKVFADTGATLTVTLARATLVLSDSIAMPLSIAGTPAVSGQTGSPYSFTPVVTGGVPPYAFTLISGALPPGLALDVATGTISGTPTTVGSYTEIGLRVGDAAGGIADLPSFDLVVAAGSVPQSISAPAIDITAPQVGDTLTVTTGEWTDNPDSYAFQWQQGGTPIAGATQATLLVSADYLGQTLSAQVTASNTAGSGAVALSAATDPVTSASALVAGLETSFNIGVPTQMVYSDADRTVAATPEINGLRTTRGQDALVGKRYFEVSIGDQINTIGLCNASSTVTSAGSVGVARAGWAGILLLHAGTNINMGVGFGAGDVVQVAVDQTAGLLWMRKNGAGIWNNTAGADPETATGGVDITGLGSTLYPHIQLKNDITSSASLRGTVDQLTHQVPTGFAPIL